MTTRFLTPARAAATLGVSTKALRLYEARGLLAPGRTAAGWRAYGPDDLARAAKIAALRALGLSLAQVARVLSGDPADLADALAAHEARLTAQACDVAERLARVRRLRADLANGQRPSAAELARVTAPALAFDLPWPWGGERFELAEIAPITWITGPLGSGKTRLAIRIAEALPGGCFLGLDRDRTELAAAIDGATGPVVVDMVEQGYDAAAQATLAARLRRAASPERPLFLMTRSTAMLDLALVGVGEAILYCPANHSPPVLAAPGHPALADCLASPEVRARLGWHAATASPSLEA